MREWMPFVKYIALKTKSQWNHNNSFVSLFFLILLFWEAATLHWWLHVQQITTLSFRVYIHRHLFIEEHFIPIGMYLMQCKHHVDVTSKFSWVYIYIYIHTLGQDTRTSRTTMPHIGRNFSSCPDVVVRKI